MKNITNYFHKFSNEFKHAFSINKTDEKLPDEEVEILDALANGIAKRKMSAPAILFLDTLRPMNYLGSQAMIFLEPFCTMVFSKQKYGKIVKILEKRESVTKLIQLLEKK